MQIQKHKSQFSSNCWFTKFQINCFNGYREIHILPSKFCDNDKSEKNSFKRLKTLKISWFIKLPTLNFLLLVNISLPQTSDLPLFNFTFFPPLFFKAKKKKLEAINTKKQKSVSSPHLFISSNLIYVYILVFSKSLSFRPFFISQGV